MVSMFNFRSIGLVVYLGWIFDLVVNLENFLEYYVGVVLGGLWKIENYGIIFKLIFDNQVVYFIGCLVMDFNNLNVVWVGIGENNFQWNLVYGDGVYKIMDGGKIFINMGLKIS